MKLSAAYRRDLQTPSGPPLPLYLRSTGSRKLDHGESHFSAGNQPCMLELIWCVRGSCELEWAGRLIHLRTNDIFWFLSDEDRQFHSGSAGFHYQWLCFDGPLAEAIFFSLQLPRKISGESSFPVALFEEIAAKLSSSAPADVAHLSGIGLQLLTRLAARNSEQSPGESVYLRCTEYIRNSFSNPDLCLDLLCERFEIPRSSLTKLFRDNMHRSPGIFIRDQRYAHACSLLKEEKTAIAEIAARCGYRNLSSFNRMIRRVSGKTPGQLRGNQPR